MKTLIFTLLLDWTTGLLHAQVRPDINTGFNTQQQKELACSIKAFLDDNAWFLLRHHDIFGKTHTAENLLTWHNWFIGVIEEHLTSIGMD